MITAVSNSFHSTEYIVSVGHFDSEAEFLRRAAVEPDSYAWRLAARLYQDIFVRSIDLKRDFDLYYQIEYASFAEYLRKRELVTRDDAADIAKTYTKSAAIFRYKYPFFFLESEPGAKLFKKLLKER